MLDEPRPASGIWTRFKAALGRLFRREPAPGRWLEGSAFSWHGVVGFRPWVLPRRDYRLYLPRGHRRGADSPLIALIHGCHQNADEIARGTRIAALADKVGALVLIPTQKDAANPYRCWNWFDPRTAAGKGEAAIVAAMLDKVQRRYGIDAARTLVAGMSSGGALAAILGLRHPRLIRNVLTHSGIAAGAATSAFTAVTVMRRGPETDVASIAQAARKRAGHDEPVRLLAIQGMADDVVASRHAAALVRQYLAFNGVAVPAGAESTLPAPDSTERDASTLPHVTRTREWRREDTPIVRLVEIEGLGHAWCGGDASLPFNTKGPPDATSMIADWLGAGSR